MSKNKKIVIILLLCIVALIFIPLLVLRDAEFSGTDDAGSQVIQEINSDYQPWFEPVFEKMLGRELPGEVESLFFSIQTAIGVGILGYCFGYLVARKKYKRTD
ncbi:MAG: energy-coupling factor ABC transporter substrate-binding protein [Lachnospiraceae bacterium]